MDTAAHDPAWAGRSEAERATVQENLRLATGGAAPAQAWRMLAELADATGPGAGTGEGGGEDSDQGESRVVAALEAAMALAPRDPLEGMLAVQMAAVHAAAMRALGRAAACTEHPQIEALYLRQAARLLHLFVRQAETLDRRARRLGRADRSRHAPPGAGPMPAAARGPGEKGRDPADEPDGAPDQDGAEILRTLIADIYARRGEEGRPVPCAPHGGMAPGEGFHANGGEEPLPKPSGERRDDPASGAADP